MLQYQLARAALATRAAVARAERCTRLRCHDFQLRGLSVLKQLYSLHIASTKVTTGGLRSLWSMQSLRELDITF